jgi:hypothetical protein
MGSEEVYHPSAPSAKRERSGVHEELEKELDHYRQLINELEERLAPVLHPAGPEVAPDMPPDIVSPMASQTRRFSSMNQDLNSLIRRIEA